MRPLKHLKSIIVIVLTACMIGVVYWIQVSMNRAHQMERIIYSQVNLRGIGLMMQEYARLNRDEPAADFGVLVRMRRGASIFHSPLSDGDGHELLSMNLDQQIDWVNTHSDYIYIRPPGAFMDIQRVPNFILAYERGNRTDGQVTVLFADGRADSIPATDAQRMIERSRSASTRISATRMDTRPASRN